MAARIPTAADVRKVAPASIPSLNVRPESFGTQVTREQEGLGSAGFGLAIKLRNQAEKAEAQDLANQMSEYARQVEMGGELLKDMPGYRTLQGMNAVNQRSVYEQKLLDNREELQGLASSDRVRSLFDPVANTHVNRTMTSIGSVSLREQKVYEEKVYEATIKELVDSAVHSSSDLNLVRANMSALYSTTLERARKIHGTSPSSIAGKTMAEVYAESEVTKAHEAVFKEIMSESPRKAEEYLALLAKNKNIKSSVMKMDPSKLTELKEKAEIRTRVVLGQEVVDALDNTDLIEATPIAQMSKAERAMWNLRAIHPGIKGDLADPKWQTLARKHVQKNYEGKDEKAIIEELEKRIRLAVQNKNLRRNGAIGRVLDHVLVKKQTLASFLADPNNKDDADLLATAQNANLIAVLRKGEKEIRFLTSSDNKTFKRLASNPDELVQTNLEAEKGSLTLTEYQKLLRQQVGEQAKRQASAEGRGSLFPKGATLVGKHAPKLVAQRTAKKENRQLLRDAEGEMSAWIQEYVKREKKPPSDLEMRRQATRMWLEITADPENTGALKTPEAGEKEITLRAFQADNLDALSPQQKAVARVPSSQLSAAFKREIQADVREYLRRYDYAGSAEDRARGLNEEEYGNLAAAALLGDDVRARALMEKIAGR